jgi:glycosyltransferase involved in cell wall biosynthesis
MQLKPLLIWLGDLTFQTILHHAYLDCKEDPRKVVRVIRAYLASLLWKRLYRKVLSGQQNVVVSSYSSVAHMARLGVSTQYWAYPWPGKPCRETIDFGKHSKPTFILFGTLSALGSRSSFDFLLKSVYPHLLRVWGAKSFTILIAGSRELPSWVQAHIQACSELKFLGFVDDLAAEVARCHAVLAPISVPIGNRSRIVTAMSMGALVIAHANTALGNPELVSGENCLLASSASKFAEYMVLAHANPDLAAKLEASARQTYLRSFLPEVASQRLVHELNFIFSSS